MKNRFAVILIIAVVILPVIMGGTKIEAGGRFQKTPLLTAATRGSVEQV